MENIPKVTVTMPVYNGETYLKEAIDSILNQTFSDFELLIIDDASTDSSAAIISSYTDKRISFVKNEKNLGVVKTTNRCLDLARGKYVARMDQDDISLSKRLQKQVEFMENHQNIGVCGTWMKAIGHVRHLSGKILKYSSDPNILKCRLLFYCPIAHPSVMINMELLNKYGLRFNNDFNYAEDYDFWVRTSDFINISNINEVLVLHRIHEKQMSNVFSLKQQNLANSIREAQLKKIIEEPCKSDVVLHNLIYGPNFKPSKDYIDRIEIWLRTLKDSDNKRIYSKLEFSIVISEIWFAVCTESSILGYWVWEKYWSSPLTNKKLISFSSLIKFLIKILIKFKR